MMEKRIEEIAVSSPYVEGVKKLRCFKGVEYLTALSIICEVGDFKRFKSAEEFMSFLGLVPGEHSSGSKRKQGSITKSGNTHVRKLMIEASWHYRYKTALSKRLTEKMYGQSTEHIEYANRAMKRLQGKFFRLVVRGKTSQTAVVAVTREFSGFIWGMMVGQTA